MALIANSDSKAQAFILATMSDQGEKTCPLCAEEMDLTDQQLKPCKCGYQICVWCWHHIMDMAQKDNTEGRCPACRTPYDKEKIVGMAVNCERLVSEVNMERKKVQKPKSKSSEGRKQLTSVRVIQRNLVYIVGLPLNLADEDLLQHKEYFGQYGKVLKVSMSRTASGVIQQFPNNTCSVYITYSQEEEAIRCIQSVHGFVLDGRSLKACFGTTKYCHAWLRNVPCNNPDCLYLHEIGSPEDSFTKDEIISAYTRSRVQQITGATNNLQRRSGNMLPPPVDGYCCNSSTAKSIARVASNNPASVPKSSPPSGSSGRSAVLPAAASWGTRVSSQQSVNGTSVKQRPPSENGKLPFSAAVANTSHPHVSDSNILRKPPGEEESQPMVDKSKPSFLKPWHHNSPVDPGSKRTTSPGRDPTSNQIFRSVKSTYNSRVDDDLSAVVNSFDHTKEGSAEDDQSRNNLCADVAWMGITTNSRNDHSCASVAIGTISDQGSIRQHENEALHARQSRNDPSMNTDGTAVASLIGISVARPEGEWRMDTQSLMDVSSKPGVEEILSFDNQRYNDAEVMGHGTNLPHSSNSIQGPNDLDFNFPIHREGSGVMASDSDSIVESRGSDRFFLPNGFAEKSVYSVEHSTLFTNEGRKEIHKGEDDIISTILSLDFDPWGESLVSPQNLAKLLSETDVRATSFKSSTPLNVHQCNQSRFSFARQEESNNQAPGVETYSPKNQPTFQDSAVTWDMYSDRLGIRNGFASNYTEGLQNFSGSPVFSSHKIPVSRSQISAPPGFSTPGRSPPPGFSNERLDQTFDAASGARFLDSTSFLRNTCQGPLPSGNYSVAPDIEFMDPAILAVGRGRLQNGLGNANLDMRSGFSPQLNSFQNDARLQLLMQRSLSAQQQNLGFHDLRDANNFSSSVIDSYGIGSRLLDQTQGTSLSPFTQLSRHPPLNSAGRWDRWNEVQGGNSLGMGEVLRNEQMGFSSNIYNGFEESKFRMPGSGDLYNRTYRM